MMVRNRTNRVVMSQRDVRQTGLNSDSSTSLHASTAAVTCCTWCRMEGRQYACLAESSHVHCEECREAALVNTDWTGSVKNNESWIPASGPCCEDCLEAAFERRKKSEFGKKGREVVDSVQNWCCERGVNVRQGVSLSWSRVKVWLEQAKERWRAGKSSSKVRDGNQSNSSISFASSQLQVC